MLSTKKNTSQTIGPLLRETGGSNEVGFRGDAGSEVVGADLIVDMHRSLGKRFIEVKHDASCILSVNCFSIQPSSFIVHAYPIEKYNMFKSESKEDQDLSNDSLPESLGKLLLRIAIGGMMLFHGVAKIKGGTAGIEGMLQEHGMPAIMAYGVYVGEILVPVLMIVGLFTRLSSLVFVFNMIIAIALAHSGELLSVGEYGGWKVELPMLYLMGALVIALVGPGNIALGKKNGLMA